jgi:hypothetical protein
MACGGGTEALPVGRHDPEPLDMQRSRALPCMEVGSGAVGHMALQSPPLQGGGVRSHRTHGDVRALRIREAGSTTTGHVVAPEPTLARRSGPVLQGTWWRMGAHPALYLDLKLVCRGTWSVGY